MSLPFFIGTRKWIFEYYLHQFLSGSCFRIVIYTLMTNTILVRSVLVSYHSFLKGPRNATTLPSRGQIHHLSQSLLICHFYKKWTSLISLPFSNLPGILGRACSGWEYTQSHDRSTPGFVLSWSGTRKEVRGVLLTLDV